MSWGQRTDLSKQTLKSVTPDLELRPRVICDSRLCIYCYEGPPHRQQFAIAGPILGATLLFVLDMATRRALDSMLWVCCVHALCTAGVMSHA